MTSHTGNTQDPRDTRDPHGLSARLPMVPVILGEATDRRALEGLLTLAERSGARVSWHIIDAPELSAGGEFDPTLLDPIKRAGVALIGDLSSPDHAERINPIIQLRKQLDLFAGVRYIRHLDGLKSRYQDLDFVIVRENTEDVYSGLEHTVHPGVVESIKVVTRQASERVARFAYQLAESQGRGSVAVIHKANIMKMSDGLFLESARGVGAEFVGREGLPDITTRDLIVDNVCMQLVMRPEQFEVILCGNLYGDILSDLGAGLVGGSEATWSEDHGDEVALFTVAQGHGARSLSGDSTPARTLLMPLVALLRHLDQGEAGERLLQTLQSDS